MYSLEDLIVENDRLIYSIIKNYKNYCDVEDLKQVAVIGLINANKNYNPSFGVKFSTYAYKYILGEIRKYAKDYSAIKVNNETNLILSKIKKVRSLLAQKLMKEPSIDEIANFLEIDKSIISNALLSENNIISIDSCISTKETDISLHEIIPDNTNNNSIENMTLQQEIEMLEEPYKSIVKYRYFEDKTQSETSKILGLSQVNVSRYEAKTLKKLRSKLCV